MVRLHRVMALLAVMVVTASAGGALAGEVTGTDPAGDVKAKGLTAKERAAIDVVSMNVTGEEGLGLFATVTFKGNIQQAIGRGNLKRALVALILQPQPGKGSPAGLVTWGAELVYKRKRISKTKTVLVPTTEAKDLRRTRSEQVGIVRNGRELFFFILGPGFSSVETVEVKVFVRLPGAGKRLLASAPPVLAVALWDAVLGERWSEFYRLVNEADKDLLCPELRALRKHLVLGITLAEGFRHDVEDEIKKTTGQPGQSDWKKRKDMYDTLIRNLTEGLARVDELIRERCGETLTADSPRWQFFAGDPSEVVLGTAFRVKSGGSRSTAAPTDPLDAVRIVLSPAGSTPRLVTNYLCPSQLPVPTVSGNTLTCSGGSLAVGQQFTLNVRMSPAPTANMGGQLYGRQDGAFKGPFTISGP